MNDRWRPSLLAALCAGLAVGLGCGNNGGTGSATTSSGGATSGRSTGAASTGSSSTSTGASSSSSGSASTSGTTGAQHGSTGGSTGHGSSGASGGSTAAASSSGGTTGTTEGSSTGGGTSGSAGTSSGSSTSGTAGCPGVGGGDLPDAGCPPGESYVFFQDGSAGCACQVADPGIGSMRSSCSYNPILDAGASVICDPVSLHCRAPRDLEPCAALDAGPGDTCDQGYACVELPGADAGTCLQPCTTSADCQDPETWCVAGAGSLALPDGGLTTSACELNPCDATAAAYQPCNSAGTADGQCLPYAGSTGLTGICTRTGQAAIGQPCAPLGGACGTCAAGGICSLSGTAAPRDSCLPACDQTGVAGPSCAAPEVCAPFVDKGLTTPNPGVCEPQATSDGLGPVGNGTFPAPHPAYPQVTRQGGSILPNPEAVVITYANYTNPDQANRGAIESYMTSLLQSSWLTTVGADYGVGTGTVDLVELSTAAPGANTNPNAITNELCSLIKNPPTNFPTPNGNTVYFFFYPETTTFTDGSCSSYGGYHSYTSGFSGSSAKCNDVVYAVLPDCPVSPAYDDLTDLAEVETSASHELIEAATDPYPPGGSLRGGYAITDGTSPWIGIGGEVGDICVWNYLEEPFGFVQRIWSNSAAAAGNESPCVPEADEPFATVSVSPTTVQVGAGQTFDFTVTGWSDQATQPFVVVPYAFDYPTSPASQISYSLDVNSLSNGQQGTLSVTVPAGDHDDYLMLLVLEANPGQSLDVWNWYPVAVCSDVGSCPY
ncbi:MAG TPA: hypothetical protein VMB50_10400 [Myxococcales bacterium]|nr:hypothetical protein [Myxococcales bacterium]